MNGRARSAEPGSLLGVGWGAEGTQEAGSLQEASSLLASLPHPRCAQ